MAGSALAGGGGLQVLLVRHGESVNNPLYADILTPVVGEPASSEARKQAEAKWLASRLDDPPLTGKGAGEAEEFGAAYAPWLAKAVGPGGRVRVYVSPFLRTCQTAVPLVSRLGPAHCAVEVRPDIFEVGGVYTETGGQRGGPGQCLSPGEIQRRFPGYDVSALGGDHGIGWYTGGWETDAEARVRAKRVAAWLRSPALHEECTQSGGGKMAWAVLVMHGHFIDLLLKALLGLEDDPSGDKLGSNSFYGRAVAINTPNTAVGHLTVLGDGKVQVHSLGRTDHLGAAAAREAGARWRLSWHLAALAVGVLAGSLLSRRSSL